MTIKYCIDIDTVYWHGPRVADKRINSNYTLTDISLLKVAALPPQIVTQIIINTGARLQARTHVRNWVYLGEISDDPYLDIFDEPFTENSMRNQSSVKVF